MKTKTSLLLMALLLTGCMASFQKPGCTQADLKNIETDRYNELTDVCQGKQMKDCPEAKTINDKYDAKEQEWAACPQ